MWNYLRKPARFSGCLFPYSIMALTTFAVFALPSACFTWVILSIYFCWQEGRMFLKTEAAFLFFARALPSGVETVWPLFETIQAF
jgi:hypothetical protein